MSLGLDYITNNHYMTQINQQKKTAEQNNSVGFKGVLSAKAAEESAKTECNFKDMWQSRFPRAYYHTMDAYKIPQGTWGRLDFPHDNFFSDKVDESILDWKPTGAEPKMTDPSLQSRMGATLGKMSIVVPPALEEKMKNDPTLAKQVMAKVENFIVTKEATKRSNRICSYVLVMDEDGEIAHTCITTSGGISGPTEEQQRQFEAEQAAKRERRAKYMEIIEESSLKRVRIEQENRIESIESRLQREQFYQQKMHDELMEKYEKGTLL